MGAAVGSDAARNNVGELTAKIFAFERSRPTERYTAGSCAWTGRSWTKTRRAPTARTAARPIYALHPFAIGPSHWNQPSETASTVPVNSTGAEASVSTVPPSDTVTVFPDP